MRTVAISVVGSPLNLITDPITQPVGHVTEKDGQQYVTLFRRGHLELWSMSELSDGTATMKLEVKMPVPVTPARTLT